MVSLAQHERRVRSKRSSTSRLHRFADPEEIAATALFLASDQSRFFCGQVLGPNGGSVMP